MWRGVPIPLPLLPPPFSLSRACDRDKLQAERTKSDVLTEAEEDAVRAELSQKYPGFKVQVEAANIKYGPS